MTRAKKENKKRALPTPEKVCDSPNSKRQSMNENLCNQPDVHSPSNGSSNCMSKQIHLNASVSPNYSFPQQMTTNQAPVAVMHTPTQSMPGQHFPYGLMNQNIQTPCYTSPSQQMQYQQNAGQYIQQSPANNIQFQQPVYQDNLSSRDLSDIVATLKRLETKMNKLDAIEQKVSTMSEKISSFERRVTSLESVLADTNKQVSDTSKRMNEIETSRVYDSQVCDDLNNKFALLESDLKAEKKKNESLLTEMQEVKRGNLRLSEEVLDVQSRSMRDNLLFHGVKECDSFESRRSENCIVKVLDMCQNVLKIENAREIRIDRAHRLGRYRPDKSRPIVVKFNFFQDKVKIKQAAQTELRDTDFRVSEQFPREIQERRRVLYPELKKALDAGKRATLSYDKLYVDGRTITADNIRNREAME